MITQPPSMDDAPTFIVGCHRSGTTLTRYLLDAHPNIACPPESKFISGLQAFLDHPQAVRGMLSMGGTMDEIYAGLRVFIEGVMSRYAARHNKKRWADKTPNYYRNLPLIDSIFAQTVRYVFIVRHPFDVMMSMEEMFSPLCKIMRPIEDEAIAGIVDRYGVSLFTWAKYWIEVNEQISYFASMTSDRCCIIRYEDLVRAPKKTLRKLLEFIGESFPDRLLEKAFSMQHSDGYQDPKIRDWNKVKTTGVGRWTSWPDIQVKRYWALVGPLARDFGYKNPSRINR